MSAAVSDAPATTATSSLSLHDALPIFVTFTADSAFAGLSFGSENPKSAVANVYVRSADPTTELPSPANAVFTDVTYNVIVFADWSRSTPPFAVPPSSWTWNVKLV